MKTGSMLSNMLLMATQKHFNQYDKGGRPYILHCLKVMYWLKTDDEELQCIALGHDMAEDCGVSFAELREAGFSDRVVNGIAVMTKSTGESYDEYRAKVKSNPDAVKVKMQDLRHNSDIRRLKGVTEKDIKRIERYHTFYLELQELSKVAP